MIYVRDEASVRGGIVSRSRKTTEALVQNKEIDFNLLSRYNTKLNIYALTLVPVFELRLLSSKRLCAGGCFEVDAVMLLFGSVARSLLFPLVHQVGLSGCAGFFGMKGTPESARVAMADKEERYN